jgi:tRNA modification GTPase
LKKISNAVNVSALNKDILKLIQAIENSYSKLDINNEKIIYNTRQLALVKSSANAISEAILGLNNGMGSDVVIVDIQKA